MTIVDSSSLIERILAAANADGPVLTQISLDVCLLAMEGGEVESGVFDALIATVRDGRFQRNRNAAILLKAFGNVFAEMIATQRAQLLPVLRDIFGMFDEWMSSYVIAMLLAESYDNNDAAELLVTLANTAPASARNSIASGLGHISHISDAWKGEVVKTLTLLARDADPDVKETALGELQRCSE